MPSILLFGVTGLVGSHLVLDLHAQFPDYPLTVYLRNTTIDAYLTSVGVSKIVHGTYDDAAKITALAAAHDIVINVGSSWDDGLSNAIVAGLKQRPASARKILLHMSGAGNFVDERWTDGAHHPESKEWSDDSVSDMKLISPAMLNGGPDTIVLTAGSDASSPIQTYIIFPSAIHGHSTGPVRALGVVQYLMHEKAKELGHIPYIGAGTTIANSIHVKDVARFVVTALRKALKDEPAGESAYERTYIIGGPDLTWKAVADAYAAALHALGLTDSPEAKSVPSKADAGAGEIPMLLASDMRFVGPRAAREGFEVREEGLLEFLKRDDIFPET